MTTIDTTDTATYTIAKADLPVALQRVAKANRRAARIGLTGYTTTVTAAEPMPIYSEDDPYGRVTRPIYFVEMVDFSITGMVPRLGNYEVIAKLESDEFAGVVSRMFPGVDDVDLSSVRIDSMQCDHCCKTRARSKTYVLRDRATGELSKVGSACLTLYTGITVSATFANPVNTLNDEMDELVTVGHGNPMADCCVPTRQLVTLAVGAVALHGWMSATKGRDEMKTATADRVKAAFGRSTSAVEQYRTLTDAADPSRVDAVLSYVRTVLRPNGSEYVANLIACTRPDTVSWDNTNLVISAVSAYDRYVDQQLKQAAAARSEWVGTVGTRSTLRVTVKSIRQIANRYAVADLVKMVTDEGNLIVWFASRGTDFTVGQTVSITARIAEHAEFRSVKETKVTHVKEFKS